MVAGVYIIVNMVNNKSYNQQSHLKYAYTFRSPQGQEVVTYNIREFAVQFGLKHGSVYNLTLGKSKSLKGWTLIDKKTLNPSGV